MVTFSIKDSLFETISKIAKQEGTNEETIINDFLSEAIEEYDDYELLEKVQLAESEFKDGETIRLDVDGFNERYGLKFIFHQQLIGILRNCPIKMM